jgi:hypothetical protein
MPHDERENVISEGVGQTRLSVLPTELVQWR